MAGITSNHGRRTYDTEVLSGLPGVSPLAGSPGPAGAGQSNASPAGQPISEGAAK